MPVTIGEILLVEHFQCLVDKLKFREDLTLAQKRELLLEANRYVDTYSKLLFTIKATFDEAQFQQFCLSLYELVDSIHSTYGYYHVLFERLENI